MIFIKLIFGIIIGRCTFELRLSFLMEIFQQNQTVLSENICCGVVGGRLDFPRSASFAAVKIVLWLEEEFSIAFKLVFFVDILINIIRNKTSMLQPSP